MSGNPGNPARTRPPGRAGSCGPDPATRPLRGGPGRPGDRCPPRSRTRPGLGAGSGEQLPLPFEPEGERRLSIRCCHVALFDRTADHLIEHHTVAPKTLVHHLVVSRVGDMNHRYQVNLLIAAAIATPLGPPLNQNAIGRRERR